MNYLFTLLLAAVLFFLLTPGVLVRLPPKCTLLTCAAFHAVVFTVAFYFGCKLLSFLKIKQHDGFNIPKIQKSEQQKKLEIEITKLELKKSQLQNEITKQELEKLEIEKKIENIPLLEKNIADKRQQIPSVEKEIADKINELDKLIKPIPK